MFSRISQIFKSNKATIDIKALIQKGAILIDVRTPAEFIGGAAPGARNIPLQELQHNIKALKKQNKPVVVYCRSGNRSGIAAQILNGKGIEAYNAGSIGRVKRLLSK